MTQVRTRFAPSPTGQIHLGNLRIAAFNYLFSRGQGGAFVLRVEDTDTDRTRDGALDAILNDLRWAGLSWDEGPDIGGRFGPYRQTEREAAHRDAAHRLLGEGQAYLCFCTDDEIERARSDPSIVGPGCPGGCRERAPEIGRERRAAGEAGAIRFRVPDGPIAIRDRVRGDVEFQGRDVGDFVLLRADGRPTYNLAVVVDDIAMEITHVIRGAGHLSNTPKHRLLFEALGAPPPVFAHLPTVLGPDGRKLSKRENSASIRELRAEGYHPDGVVNYVSLLGWSPGGDREILTPEDLGTAMDLDRVGASDTMFDPDKLRWCSGQHIALMPLDELARAVAPYIDRERFPLPDARLPGVLECIRTRLQTFSDVDPALELLYPGETVLRTARDEIRSEGDPAISVVRGVCEHLSSLESFEPDSINRAIREWGKESGVRGPGLFHPVRMAVMAARSGPDLGLVMSGLGRDVVLARMQRVAGEV